MTPSFLCDVRATWRIRIYRDRSRLRLAPIAIATSPTRLATTDARAETLATDRQPHPPSFAGA
jgi:hypothetical protein